MYKDQETDSVPPPWRQRLDSGHGSKQSAPPASTPWTVPGDREIGSSPRAWQGKPSFPLRGERILPCVCTDGPTLTPVCSDTITELQRERERITHAINELQDQELFLRGLARWFGYSLTTVPYRPGARKHGATKYSLRRSLELAVTGIASHSIRPLRTAIWLSLSFAVVGGLLIVYSIVSFLFVQHTVAGWTSIMAAIAILGAVQLLVLAIIGEYVGRILRETRRRPRYVIAETEAAAGEESETDRKAH